MKRKEKQEKQAVPSVLPPRSNPDLRGHSLAENEILESLSQRRMPHAWMIAGQSGIGKATLAYRLARYILGEHDQKHKSKSLFTSPESPHFRFIHNNSHPDLLIIERSYDTKRQAMTTEILVEDVRTVHNFLHQTPGLSSWRVVVVEGAEHMNRYGQNALLKTLEEPPPYSLLILITEKSSFLLPTIRSRCRLLKLKPLTDNIIEELLKYHYPQMSLEERQGLVVLSAGSIGRAISLYQDKGFDILQQLLDLLKTLPQFDWNIAHHFIDNILSHNKEKKLLRLQELILWWLAQLARTEVGMIPPVIPNVSFSDILYRLLEKRCQFDSWATVWEKTLYLFRRNDYANLDPKQTLLHIFTLFFNATNTPEQSTS